MVQKISVSDGRRLGLREPASSGKLPSLSCPARPSGRAIRPVPRACCAGPAPRTSTLVTPGFQKSVFINNVGECDLHVSSVELRHKHRHFRLINNPFPATLRPGASLEVVIRYRATEKYPKACELIVKCDDPDTPVRALDVIAYTLWQHFCCDCCDPCRAKCCEECSKGCCDKCRCHDRDREHHEERDEDREHHDEDDD